MWRRGTRSAEMFSRRGHAHRPTPARETMVPHSSLSDEDWTLHFPSAMTTNHFSDRTLSGFLRSTHREVFLSKSVRIDLNASSTIQVQHLDCARIRSCNSLSGGVRMPSLSLGYTVSTVQRNFERFGVTAQSQNCVVFSHERLSLISSTRICGMRYGVLWRKAVIG